MQKLATVVEEERRLVCYSADYAADLRDTMMDSRSSK